MIFAAFEFLAIFLPFSLAVYYVCPARFRNLAILLLSWAFYGWWRVDFLLLLVVVTVFTFLVCRAMAAARPGRVRAWFLLGILGNLGVLAYFKYANFVVLELNQVLAMLGRTALPHDDILLPIGLSFYVLQSVSYLIDVRRGDVPVSRSFIRYAAYKALFPQLIAGPIVRYAEIREDLEARRQTLAQFGAGARRFMLGFAMKVCFADTLAPLVEAAFDLPEPTLVDAWTGALAYTLQLYFDFAGYSAMAIGLALMLGFRFPENFDTPYLAGSIQNFWQRWHMTLSRFLRDYLYVPLGGNRRGPVRTYLNLLTTMAIGGFWHGANWTFLLWGIWHGGLLALHRGWRAAGHGPMPWLAGHLLTLLAVILGWVLFRAPDLAGALRMFAGMAGAHGAGLSEDLAWQVTSDQWACLGLALAAIYAPKLWPARLTLGPIGWVAAPVLAFALGVVLLYSRSAVPFLYFQF